MHPQDDFKKIMDKLVFILNVNSIWYVEVQTSIN